MKLMSDRRIAEVDVVSKKWGTPSLPPAQRPRSLTQSFLSRRDLQFLFVQQISGRGGHFAFTIYRKLREGTP